jgi:hypothetical protein
LSAVCHEPLSCIQFLRDHTPLHELADWLEKSVRNGPKAVGVNPESFNPVSPGRRGAPGVANYCANNAAFEFIPVHVGTISFNETKNFKASGLGTPHPHPPNPPHRTPLRVLQPTTKMCLLPL